MLNSDINDLHWKNQSVSPNKHDLLTDNSSSSGGVSCLCVHFIRLQSHSGEVFACLLSWRLPLCPFTLWIKQREEALLCSVNLAVVFQCAMALMCVVLMAGCVHPDASLSRDHQQTGHHQYWYENWSFGFTASFHDGWSWYMKPVCSDRCVSLLSSRHHRSCGPWKVHSSEGHLWCPHCQVQEWAGEEHHHQVRIC